MLFFSVSGFLFVRAVYTCQIRDCCRENVFGVFRLSSARRVEKRLLDELTVVIEQLTFSFIGSAADLFPVIFHPVAALELFELRRTAVYLAMRGVAQRCSRMCLRIAFRSCSEDPGERISTGSDGLRLERLYMKCRRHLTGNHALHIIFKSDGLSSS